MRSVEGAKNYDVPAVIPRVRAALNNGGLSHLERGDLALAAHLGKYFERSVAMALRGEIGAVKREYDSNGEDYKTPFALAEIDDPLHREMVLGNVTSFATTQGCTGGCDWCCYDALPVAAKNLEVVPLQQKLHFFDELFDLVSSVSKDPEFLKRVIHGIGLYMDTDPFDDPDVVTVATHIYKKWGATPFFSTVVPRSGVENFKILAKAAAKHERVRNLQALSGEFAVVKKGFLDLGMTDSRQINFLLRDSQSFVKIGNFSRLLDNIAGLDEVTRRLVLEVNGASFDQYLEAFGLGRAIDYMDGGSSNFPKLNEFLATRIRVYDKFEILLSQLVNLRLRYCDDFASLGIGKIEDFDFMSEGNIQFMNSDIALMVGEVSSMPDVGEMRVSLVEHREREVEKLMVDPDYRFYANGRGAVVSDPGDNVMLAGKAFFDSGRDNVGYGIACNQGMKLTPFGLFNVIPGRITHEFPQGRVMVPFAGLGTSSELAQEGDRLDTVLENTIAIYRTTFKSPMAPADLYVYDGMKRVRRIHFDHLTYEVLKDEVVQEDVASLNQLLDLKTAWQDRS